MGTRLWDSVHGGIKWMWRAHSSWVTGEAGYDFSSLGLNGIRQLGSLGVKPVLC